MLGTAAPVLVPDVPEIASVRVAVGEMALDDVMDRGLGDLAEAGDEPVDQREHEREAHGPKLPGTRAPRKPMPNRLAVSGAIR